MSKARSGHFFGTIGYKSASNLMKNAHNYAIMASDKLDLREHPTKYKQLGSKKLKELKEKENSRTLTKEEYKLRESNKRLAKRRNDGIKAFWEHEQFLIRNNLPTTRNWTSAMREAILRGKKPKFKGVTIQSHHKYSVAKYPHLANVGEIIYPATKNEHIQGWHGGNTRNSLPGIPIKYIKEF